MTVALVTFGFGEYEVGAEVLFRSIRRHTDVSGVEMIVLRDSDILVDYSDVPVSEENFPQVAKKLFALTLPYDRVIMLDADMLCIRDCRFLWSGWIGALPLYAVRDTASPVYYWDSIRRIGLNVDMLFNTGTVVYNRNRLPDLHEALLREIRTGCLEAYDGSDQGYLNHFCQRHGIETGYLPGGYNYVLDENMPHLRDEAQYIVHFTGAHAKPWRVMSRPLDWRWRYYRMWDAARGGG